MILVLAGTSEGREVLEQLHPTYEVISAVVSPYGAQLLAEVAKGNEIFIGELDLMSLLSLIKARQVDTIIDATHPFAQIISVIAMEAAAQTGIVYIRLERPATPLPTHPLVHPVQHLEEIKNYLHPGETLFSTVGSKNLSKLAEIAAEQEIRMVTRVLPSSEVIKSCERLGLSSDQIVAMKGPFSTAMNQELFRHYRVNAVFSKESGMRGGVDTKIEAAVNMGIPILIWTRPVLDYPVLLHSVRAVCDAIELRQQKNNEDTGRLEL